MRAVYFDLETGGKEEWRPIIQIAAAAVDEKTWSILSEIEIKIAFDESQADPEALRINHYDAEVWKKQAVLSTVAVDLFARFLNQYKDLTMISKRTGRPYQVARLAGHNAASFDWPRLRALFEFAGKFLPADPRVRDTLHAALWWFDGRCIAPQSYRLETLCKYFNIPLHEGQAHDALEDVRLTIQLARALRGEMAAEEMCS
jgi:DNA polymerase III epsilon subunit-like protein